MSIGPKIDQSTSSSSRLERSSNWRSLTARCNAREKRQRLCSVIVVFPECCEKQQSPRNGRRKKPASFATSGGVAAPITDLLQNVIHLYTNATRLFALHH